MLVVYGHEITMVRGDTANLTLTLYDGCNEYYPQEGDTIRFAVRKAYNDGGACAIVKTIPVDTLTLTLEPSDTKTLPEDKYVYEIELITGDGEIDTFIDNGTLKLKPEVYING